MFNIFELEVEQQELWTSGDVRFNLWIKLRDRRMLSVHLTFEPGTNCYVLLSIASQLHYLHNAGHYDLIVITPAAWGHWVVIPPSISWDISPGIIGINEMPRTQVPGHTHCTVHSTPYRSQVPHRTPIPHPAAPNLSPAFHSYPCHLQLYFPYNTAALLHLQSMVSRRKCRTVQELC